MTSVFDGHNDALSRLWCAGGDPVAEFARPVGHVNLPDCEKGRMGGGFFALYSPEIRAPFDFSILDAGDIDMPLPPAIESGPALEAVIGQAGIAHALAAAGYLDICTDGPGLSAAFSGDRLACLLHLEGADCIGPDLLALDALYALGVRSLGPVWSRPTIFGAGVPFKFGRDGDTGAGLTADGHRLVARCHELGIIIDTSHMTMRGFWDVAETGRPVVATHSNAYALCHATRNLTDDQLRAVGETDGMAGLNFAAPFLEDDGWRTGKSNIEACVRQIDYMIGVAGEDHVGLGSDFDGAPMPEGLGSAADLGALVDAMRGHGFGEALIDKLCHGNWLAFLCRALGTQ